ncbi:MAG: amidohydrolase family protein [Acidimicrobiia bacterium]
MLDTLIRDVRIVDGTGRPGRTGSVGIRDGRVVALDQVDEPARRTIDAEGLTLAPGFVDIHTHYDAQAFWDTTLSPSPLHGVTTVIGGNCGFTIAPLTPEDADYLMRMLARVEGMPLESLQRGVPWDWRSTAEYLDRLDGTLVPNAGFLVGHSAIRRAVMHDEALDGKASVEQLDAMRGLLAEGLRAGGLGFSSTWSTSHNDHEGHPVPSRAADLAELVTLCEVVGEHPGTTLEFIPGLAPFGDDLFEAMAAMSRAANRPLNWNVLQVYGKNRELVDHQLAASDYAAQHGGRVHALTLPDSLRFWLNFKSGFIFDILPGWDRLMALPPEEKLAQLSDPVARAEWDRLAQSMIGPSRSVANWGTYLLVDTFSDEYRRFTGWAVGAIATELGQTPWDTLADIVIADGLRTVVTSADRGQDDASWQRRVEVWTDPRAVVGASDAGAHVDMIDSFAYCTTLLAQTVRARPLLTMEEAVMLLTDVPARLYGLTERGRVQEGWHADLVLFDPDRIGPAELHTRFDLPGGAGRLYGGAEGVEHVFVGGAEVVSGVEFTGEHSGTLLRAGRDTETVTARSS